MVNQEDSTVQTDEIEVPTLPVVQIRKTKKKKRQTTVRKEYEVKVIPATKGVIPIGEVAPTKRVAAYCRVSTDEEAQATSYDLQVQHYTEYIAAHDGWVLAGIYADEGLSGTQTKKREQFNQMIQDCEAGKVDMILTKSISRFARNTVDCLTNIRKLKSLNPPVEIYFEKERLYSLDDKTDMVLSLMASIAQEESRSISANIRWAIRNRMKNGTQKVTTASLLGYETDDNGNMTIIRSEAEIVTTIYRSFVQGVHPGLIAVRLNALGLKTVYGNDWSGSSVRSILKNEKYCGDVLMQKTITIDYLSHQTKVNEGEVEQYYIADHHDAIVSRELWNAAQKLLKKRSWKRWKQREQQRLLPVRSGRLKGFISISQAWKEVSVARLLSATKKISEETNQEEAVTEPLIIESEENEMSECKILEGFEVVELEEGKCESTMSITATNLKFNKATAVELGYPKYVRMLINAATKQAAIQPCKENTKNAVEFSKDEKSQNYAVVLKVPAMLTAVRKLSGLEDETGSLVFNGKIYPNDGIIIYDVASGQPIKKRGRRKTSDELQK